MDAALDRMATVRAAGDVTEVSKSSHPCGQYSSFTAFLLVIVHVAKTLARDEERASPLGFLRRPLGTKSESAGEDRCSSPRKRQSPAGGSNPRFTAPSDEEQRAASECPRRRVRGGTRRAGTRPSTPPRGTPGGSGRRSHGQIGPPIGSRGNSTRLHLRELRSSPRPRPADSASSTRGRACRSRGASLACEVERVPLVVAHTAG